MSTMAYDNYEILIQYISI